MTSRAIAALALAATILLAGCASPADDADAGGSPTGGGTKRGEMLGSHEEVKELPENGYWVFPFGSHVPVEVLARFQVMGGGPVDAYLATGDVCGKWGTRDFVPAKKRLEVLNGTLEGIFPAGDLCIAIDNAGFGYGQAEPTGPVTVGLNVTMYERVRA